ncbi:MAG: hypothetical protein Q9211_002944, partial [Gyalolechia sp. 1 TL-2023]
FLFNTVVNTTQSEAVERNMTTGRHQVRDVICKQCKETVGWKYDKAYEASEKYKEGKFILEAELLFSLVEDVDENGDGGGTAGKSGWGGKDRQGWLFPSWY